MRVKPKPKTCYSRRCVIYDIATGTRSEAPSITKAAAKIGCSTSFLGQIIRAGMNTNGFVVAYIEDEQKALVKLRALQAQGDYKPHKQRSEPTASVATSQYTRCRQKENHVGSRVD